jgi:hypothetical protein
VRLGIYYSMRESGGRARLCVRRGKSRDKAHNTHNTTCLRYHATSGVS